MLTNVHKYLIISAIDWLLVSFQCQIKIRGSQHTETAWCYIGNR